MMLNNYQTYLRSHSRLDATVDANRHDEQISARVEFINELIRQIKKKLKVRDYDGIQLLVKTFIGESPEDDSEVIVEELFTHGIEDYSLDPKNPHETSSRLIGLLKKD